jgi:hypothetical protein
VKRAQLLAKHNGMKVWWYWEHVGGTQQKLGEPFENLMGTHWKHKNKKPNLPLLPKRKNLESLSCMLHHLIG